MANAKFTGSDLAIVLGSSLKVEPAASLAFKAKRRWRDGVGKPRPRSVICNLQPTKRDEEADLVIHATCDTVLEKVLALCRAPSGLQKGDTGGGGGGGGGTGGGGGSKNNKKKEQKKMKGQKKKKKKKS